VFCIYLRTNSDLCHLQHKLIGFYNLDEKCSLRCTDWAFKWSGLRFVFKGLKCSVDKNSTCQLEKQQAMFSCTTSARHLMHTYIH